MLMKSTYIQVLELLQRPARPLQLCTRNVRFEVESGEAKVRPCDSRHD